MQPPPARIGMGLADIETPALLIDLDAFERNLTRMAAAAAEHGVRLRPHAKTHKSAIIAAKQVRAGAVGMCCQKVAEAEALVAGGVHDVLVTNEVWGASKLARLAALARHARIGVCIDDAAAVTALNAAAECFASQVHVLVEIDVGQNRCGVAPGAAAVDLARAVAASPFLMFDGLQAYHGAAQHFRTIEERRTAIARAGEATRTTVEMLRAAGLACRTVGGAGTGTFDLEAASGIWNEVQPGSYVFMDADYAKNRDAEGAPFERYEHALFVLATVMSAPTSQRAVIDAGHKALSNDSGFPSLVDLAGVRYTRPSDEHGVLDLTEAAQSALRAGDRVLLIPGHCDPTVNLHDWYVGVRRLQGMAPGAARHQGAYVEALWRIDGRGALS